MSGNTIGQGFNLGSAELAKALSGNTQVSEKFADAAQKSAQALFTTRVSEDAGTAKPRGDLNTPPLTEPTERAKGELNGAGKLTLLLGQLMAVLGDVSLAQLESRIATWRAMMDAQVAMGEKLSGELKQAVGEAEQATEAYQAALGDLKTAKSVLEAAKQKQAMAQAKLDGLTPDDSGYQQALAARDQAANEAQAAKLKADKAEQVATDAHVLAKDKTEKADKLLTQAQGLNVRSEAAQQGAEDHLTGVAKLTMLMAMFVEMVGKNSEDSLKNDLALFQAMQEGRQKEMDKKSAEYKEEVRKAEELNRTMGCIGKILGAVLTVVSVVAAAFTGGASLALAAIGVALMVADEVVKATTGVSFMEEALKPLMDKVLKPLMDLIGKAITKALEGLGVDKKTAELAGSIIGAVLAAVAMVAVIVVVAVVGKGAASKLGGALSKLVGDAIKKMVPNMLKELAKNGSKVLSQGFQRLANSLGLQTDAAAKQMMANTLSRVVVGGEVVQATSQAGGNVAQGVFMKNASDMLADFTLARASMDQIEQWLKQAVEVFASTQKITQELTTTMSAAMQQNAEAGRFVLRQSHA
ncbi:pathogenicity island 1 effector protein SipB [Chromobacterium sp. ATCC 53434]|uniref:type III secretion system translocon subunit SctE n=1 Tax=Chromobacterium sp. (strain ATCC 53434 / SC 14030) TaxID=2059672 RepID=UPI000C78E05C|nr:type III secretion system translocon subunit SctE [Chromobacterium sp. ATCC 53434]AUH51329.1 pathogenicity island 1 effector protein SipB [Chromobacterium sp. ATCC 53434]